MVETGKSHSVTPNDTLEQTENDAWCISQGANILSVSSWFLAALTGAKLNQAGWSGMCLIRANGMQKKEGTHLKPLF